VITALAKQNFVTMRVEEPGQGDSEGPACTDVKATAELQAQSYIAGLKALKSYDYVDSAKIFVFAHSLGPLVGSLVIPRESVRGFIAAETIGRSWFEYGLENVRLQSALLGESLDEVERDVRMHEKCAHDFYVLHHTYDEVTKIGQQCADMVRSYAGMPYTFMQQIGDINLAAQWKQVDIPVLVLYGTSDPATSADESRYLVNLINSFHPGRATYVELPGMGHDLYKYDSQLEFLTRRNNPAKQHAFDDEFTDAVLRWLNQQLQA
jgi:alpha-beta hydrolase superfamily lysophospholipase